MGGCSIWELIAGSLSVGAVALEAVIMHSPFCNPQFHFLEPLRQGL